MSTHISASGRPETSADRSQPQFATLQEVADILKVSIRTVQNMMGAGMPYYEPVPGRRLFCLSEIFEWLRQHKRRVRGTLSGYVSRKAQAPAKVTSG
jgi:hypothetical protein